MKKLDFIFCENCEIFIKKERYTEEDVFEEKNILCPVCGQVLKEGEATK